MAKRSGEAAYFVVDLEKLPPAARQEVLEDAALGGGTFGVRVVELIYNGPATTQIYGVYKGADEVKWNEARADLGVEEDPEVDPDDAVRVAREEADRQAAEANAAQDAAIDAIAGKRK